jgi:2-phosphosulfolactate phosphatase
MNIEIFHLVEGARKARGLTVIIDVFRAFSTACYIMQNGADRIITVSLTEEAFRLKEKNPGYILSGEEDERFIPGFDYGNSPYHILNVDFTGKTVVQRTSAGTQGLVNAADADELLAGSFVNAGAIIKYIDRSHPEKVSLVGMGYSARKQVEEDQFCAQYIRNGLLGKHSDFSRMVKVIKNTSARRFYDPVNADFSPPEDVDLCLALNRFNFVLKAEKLSSGLIVLKRIEIE